MGSRFLLIGLNPGDQESVRGAATPAGHAVSSCPTGVEGAKIIAEKNDLGERPVDLVFLEKDLPDMSALAWLSMIRQTRGGQNLPIIVLSREVIGESQVVEFFDAGVDDLVQAPCAAQEIAARARAVMRRRAAPAIEESPVLEIGPILLDPAARQCRVRGKIAGLRPREFELLDILMRKAGRTLSRPYLLEVIWGMDKTSDTRAVDVGVSRLRRSLGIRAGKWVETVERYGYRFRVPEI
ncbi:MAG: response regulator transcription factor [Elusimicrobiota bacterium]